MLPLQSLHRTKCHYAIHNASYAQRSRKFITTSELVKSFEVDSSHMPLSSQVKSSRMWPSRRWSTWGHFSLKSGHVSVPQRLAGLIGTRLSRNLLIFTNKGVVENWNIASFGRQLRFFSLIRIYASVISMDIYPQRGLSIISTHGYIHGYPYPRQACINLKKKNKLSLNYWIAWRSSHFNAVHDAHVAKITSVCLLPQQFPEGIWIFYLSLGQQQSYRERKWRQYRETNTK